MLNLNQIPLLVERSFDSLVKDDPSLLKEAISTKEALSLKQPVLGELFWTDFSVEWNRTQSQYFIEKNLLLDTDSQISRYPSVWLSTWNAKLQSELSKYDLGESFDFRTFPFSEYVFQIDRLKIILNTIFLKTEAGYNNAHSISKKLLNYTFSDNNEHSNTQNVIRNIFLIAVMDYFRDVISPKNIDRDLYFIFSSYYGKQNVKNKLLFTNYITTKGLDEETIKAKEKGLILRNEDSKYWKYLLSIINEAAFKKQFMECFDIKWAQEKVNMKVLVLKCFKPILI